MKKLFPTLLLLALTACQANDEAVTVILPNAHVNQPYNYTISIDGGIVHSNSLEIKNDFEKNTNLRVYPSSFANNVNYNEIIITGVPKTLGKYQIYINGSFYGGGTFEKSYELNVEK